jgi:hypothetical protein
MQAMTPFLLTAPKIAGLLPASTGSTTFQLTDTRLAALSYDTRQHLISACQQLFSLALDCLTSAEPKIPALNMACMRFAAEIERLAAPYSRPSSPLRPPLRYRSRAEMDAELQGITDQLLEHLNQLPSRRIAGEVSHVR